MLLSQFDESIAALKESTEYLDGEISAVKAKEQTEKSEALAKEIEETKQEILIKIIEVEEAKVQVGSLFHYCLRFVIIQKKNIYEKLTKISSPFSPSKMSNVKLQN